MGREARRTKPPKPPHPHEPSAADPNICAICGGYPLDHDTMRLEVFRYVVPGVGEAVFDISLAKELVALPGGVLTIVDIPLDEMARIVARNSHNPAHLPDVDSSQPGIAAPLNCEGRIAYVLIDGHHRIARALKDGKIFKARLLTDAATALVLIDCPDELRPR